VWGRSALAANSPQGGCMNPTQSSSEQFMQNLKSVGGSESDVNDAAYVVRDQDTVESVVSGLRIEQQQHGTAKEPAVLHAVAEVMVSRRDEHDPAHHAGASQEGSYQLDSVSVQANAHGKSSPRRTSRTPRSGRADGSRPKAPSLGPSTFLRAGKARRAPEPWCPVTTGRWAGTDSRGCQRLEFPHGQQQRPGNARQPHP
jgi:hypothetical protein